jgi:hypothetical protein
MWDTLAVIVIVGFVGCIALRSIVKTLRGQGGCGGSCACKGGASSQETGPADVIQLGDLRDRNHR